MSSRDDILDHAADLLARSSTGEVSTRAVCEAAGVTQPVLYRLFGDKDSLLAAVVDRVWDSYLTMKRAARESPDPLDDLRSGWDGHTAFALANPHAYRLLFGSALTARPEAGREAMDLLRGVLARLAAQGRLRVPLESAAQIVMAANTGVALGVLLHSELFGHAGVSATVRDATLRSIVDDDAPPEDAAAVAATTLRTRLARTPSAPPGFTAGEAGLLDEWLRRIETHSRKGTPS